MFKNVWNCEIRFKKIERGLWYNVYCKKKILEWKKKLRKLFKSNILKLSLYVVFVNGYVYSFLNGSLR